MKLTPLKTIKAYCKGCIGEAVKTVALCPDKACPLYGYRSGRNPWHSSSKHPVPPNTPHPGGYLKAIANHCRACCCDSAHERRLCPATECRLHEYRNGKGAKAQENENE